MSVAAPVLHGASQGQALKGCQTLSQNFVDPADVAPGCQEGGKSISLAQRGLGSGFGSGLLQDPLLVLKLLLTLLHVLEGSKAGLASGCNIRQ